MSAGFPTPSAAGYAGYASCQVLGISLALDPATTAAGLTVYRFAPQCGIAAVALYNACKVLGNVNPTITPDAPHGVPGGLIDYICSVGEVLTKVFQSKV